MPHNRTYNSIMQAAEVLSTTLRALVLNASYEPLRIISWQKALIMWFQDKVDVLEYHSTKVRSVSDSFHLPSVLRLKTYIRPKKIDGVRFCRENVYIRDSYVSVLCKSIYSSRIND